MLILGSHPGMRTFNFQLHRGCSCVASTIVCKGRKEQQLFLGCCLDSWGIWGRDWKFSVNKKSLTLVLVPKRGVLLFWVFFHVKVLNVFGGVVSDSNLNRIFFNWRWLGRKVLGIRAESLEERVVLGCHFLKSFPWIDAERSSVHNFAPRLVL